MTAPERPQRSLGHYPSFTDVVRQHAIAKVRSNSDASPH